MSWQVESGVFNSDNDNNTKKKKTKKKLQRADLLLQPRGLKSPLLEETCVKTTHLHSIDASVVELLRRFGENVGHRGLHNGVRTDDSLGQRHQPVRHLDGKHLTSRNYKSSELLHI